MELFEHVYVLEDLAKRQFSEPLEISYSESDGRTVFARIVKIEEEERYPSIYILYTNEGDFGVSRSREIHVANPEVIAPTEPKNKCAVVRVISEFETEYSFIRARDAGERFYSWRSSGGSLCTWAEICAMGTPEILFGGVE